MVFKYRLIYDDDVYYFMSQIELLNQASRLTNGVLPIDIDFSVSIERTNAGLELITKSEFLRLALPIIEKVRQTALIDSYSYMTVNVEDVCYMGNLFRNGQDGKINLPYSAYSMGRGIQHCTYKMVVPETMYTKYRTALQRALVDYLTSVINMYASAIGASNIRVNTLFVSKHFGIKKVKKSLNGYKISKDGLISKSINGVSLTGVELEGAWRVKTDDMYRDGSVTESLARNISCHCDEDACDCDPFAGETNSQAVPIDEIDQWIDSHYPDRMDSSCGIHVHISTNGDKLAYGKLMTPRFFRYYLKRYQEWGMRNNINEGSRFWNRLAGNVYYARKSFKAMAQFKASRRVSDRYCMLNYCYGLHETLESRLLPTFNESRIAKSAIHEFYDIVNTYLADNADEPIFEGGCEICV